MENKKRVNADAFARLKELINITEVTRRAFPEKSRGWFAHHVHQTYGKGFTKEQMAIVKITLKEIAKEINAIANEL